MIRASAAVSVQMERDHQASDTHAVVATQVRDA
jgi:hypothetical protein